LTGKFVNQQRAGADRFDFRGGRAIPSPGNAGQDGGGVRFTGLYSRSRARGDLAPCDLIAPVFTRMAAGLQNEALKANNGGPPQIYSIGRRHLVGCSRSYSDRVNFPFAEKNLEFLLGPCRSTTVTTVPRVAKGAKTTHHAAQKEGIALHDDSIVSGDIQQAHPLRAKQNRLSRPHPTPTRRFTGQKQSPTKPLICEEYCAPRCA